MKKFLFFILIFICCNSNAQHLKETAQQQFLDYTGLLIKKDLKGAIKYTNPAIFKYVTQEQLLAAMELLYNNPKMSFAISNPKVLNIEELGKQGGEHYMKLVYSNDISLKIADMPVKDSAIYLTAFKTQFGDDHVTFNADANTFDIYAKKNAIANSTDTQKWTFAVLDDSQKQLILKIIPQSILEKLSWVD